jgi:ComF family protein
LDEKGLCGLCRAGVRGFDAAYSYSAYDGVVRRLIHLYKYERIRSLARPLADLLLRALPRDERFDCMVPVPLHWMRRWKRGFNQSDLLARKLSRRTGIPVERALKRLRRTKVQAGLSNHARRNNMSRAFRARPVAGRRILLIDDVMTTGATATACAQALKKAGAARVALLTVARADRRLPAAQLDPYETMVGENSDHAE